MGMKLYSCIVFYGKDSEKRPMKYRNVNNLDKFYTFAQKLGAINFNVYEKETRAFQKKVWIPENYPRNLVHSFRRFFS